MRDDQVSDARNEHDGRAEREVLSTIGEERQLNDDRQAQHTLTTCCHTTVRKIKTKKMPGQYVHKQRKTAATRNEAMQPYLLQRLGKWRTSTI